MDYHVRSIAAVILLLASCPAASVKAKDKPTDPWQFSQLAQAVTGKHTQWAILGADSEVAPRLVYPKDFAPDMDQWGNSDEEGYEAEFELFRKNLPVLKEVFSGPFLLKQTYNPETAKQSVFARPVRFVKFGNQTILLLPSGALGTVLNSLRMTARERAASVITGDALPFLQFFYRVAGGSRVVGVTHIGVTIAYGVKDFTQQGGLADGETATVIMSTADLQAFIDLAISEDQLLAKSLVLIGDKHLLRRVELQLK